MSVLTIPANAHAPITPNQVKVEPNRPPQFEDAAALALVVQNAQKFEQWQQEHQWPLYWREADVLYQSPRTSAFFENSTVTRSNVSRFTVAKHVNSIVPQIMSGIFYDSPPFVLRPRPGTTQETARAKTALFGALLEDCEFQVECEHAVEGMVLNGTCIVKGGCFTEKFFQKRFKRKVAAPKFDMPLTGSEEAPTAESDEFDVETVEIERFRMFFENCDLGTVLVSPAWRTANQIHKAPEIIHRRYVTFKDLDDLRNDPDYDIPSTEELKRLFFPPVEMPANDTPVMNELQGNATVHHAAPRDEQVSADPLLTPLKLDEQWDDFTVKVVLQDKLLIRNNEHHLPRKPFFSANWWNIQNAGYGLGLGRLIGADQRVEQGSTNAALDILSYGVNPQYARSRAANVPTQQIRSRLSGIIDVDGKVDEAFKLIETPKIPPEIWQVIQHAKQASESVSGADEGFVQGSLPARGGSSIGRTATGAGQIAAASAGRIQGPGGRFVNNVFLPFIAFMDELVKERMPIKEIRAIIGDELGDSFKLDLDNFMNSRLRYECLAGAHLAAKKAMAQSLPFLIQIFENPHMLQSLNSTGWTVDIKELFDMLMEMSEWKNTRQVVRKMTKEEAAAYQQSQQGAALEKVKGDIIKEDQKHQNRMAEADQKGEIDLAQKVIDESFDRAGRVELRQEASDRLEPRARGNAESVYSTTGR